MKQKPKDPEEPIITRRNWMAITIYGVIITVFITASYFLSHFRLGHSAEISNNISFFSLAFIQLFHVFDMRDFHENVLNNQVTRNKYIWWALALCIVLIAVAYYVPVFHKALSFEYLKLEVWGLIAGTIIITIVANQIAKRIFNI